MVWRLYLRRSVELFSLTHSGRNFLVGIPSPRQGEFQSRGKGLPIWYTYWKMLIRRLHKQPSRGLRKRCSENMQQIYKRISNLLQIYCVFSEQLFLRTPLDGCFWRLFNTVVLRISLWFMQSWYVSVSALFFFIFLKFRISFGVLL